MSFLNFWKKKIKENIEEDSEDSENSEDFEDSEDSEDSEEKTGIAFLIEDGIVNIHIFWNQFDDDTAQQLGILLYNLNSGHLNEMIKNLLDEFAKKEPSKAEQLAHIIFEWTLLEQSDKKAVVSPLEVMKL